MSTPDSNPVAGGQPPAPEPASVTAPAPKQSRAGRNLPAAVGSAIVLLGGIATSLFFWKAGFMIIVVAAVVFAVWELGQAFASREIRLVREPLLVGGVAIVVSAYVFGTPSMGTATAVTVLAAMLWRLRGGVAGYVRDVTATAFTVFYVPFLGAFVALMLAEPDGALAIVTFILVTIASDIGGYAAGVLFGKHPMAPVISPKKSWEGFAGSTVSCVLVGFATVVYLLDGTWWVGVLLGLIAVVTATLGDLCESVIKRDLGIKDMSQIIPGHGGLMDRLDSLLATAAPTYLLLHYLVF
jgi:phosphatidate cytidylyltransferase